MFETKVISKRYIRNFAVLLLSVVFIGMLVSAIFLYADLYRPLTSHYGAVISIITEIRDSLIFKTVTITLVFVLLASLAIAVLSILYSHRIAGPLYRIRMYLRSVTDGSVEHDLKLRNRDAIHSFAEAINDMIRKNRGRVDAIDSELSVLKGHIRDFESLTKDGKPAELVRDAITVSSNKIHALLNAIHLHDK